MHAVKEVSAAEFKAMLMKAYYNRGHIHPDDMDRTLVIVTCINGNAVTPTMIFVAGTPPKGAYFGWGYYDPATGKVRIRAPYKYNRVMVCGYRNWIRRDLDTEIDIVPDDKTVIYTYDQFDPRAEISRVWG